MDRQAILKVFVVAVFIGLLAGIVTLNSGYGLGAFVIVFLGFGGYEILQGQRREREAEGASRLPHVTHGAIDTATLASAFGAAFLVQFVPPLAPVVPFLKFALDRAVKRGQDLLIRELLT